MSVVRNGRPEGADAMLRILVVSPRFAPSNAPDIHRARLLIRHARNAGWLAEVLAVSPDDVQAPVDTWLSDQLPPEVPIHRVRAVKRMPIRALWARSLLALMRKGSALLSRSSFDVVFFSTTEFPLLALGPIWKRRHGVPFCVDLQDPWLTDYYRTHPEIRPPGGRIKYWLSERIGRALEPWVVRHCSGFVAVSAMYLSDLRSRYGRSMDGKPAMTLPFPAEPRELEDVPVVKRAATGTT